jgi:GNAT superfamily N-acetyltransferase
MDMERISLTMVHHLKKIPDYPFPASYKMRSFTGKDEAKWASILTAAGEFPDQEAALRRFQEEFEPHLTDVKERMYFIENEEGEAIGTATAWYGLQGGEEMGRIHWVGIVPEHQGKKLAKPLLCFLLEKLAGWHEKAYLKTQTTNVKAVNAYLGLGFVPFIQDETQKAGWELLEKELEKKIL